MNGNGGGINSAFVAALPFARAAHAAAGPDQFFIGSSDSFQVDVWDAAGRLVRIIRVAKPEVPVTEDLLQAYVDAEIQRRREVFEARGESFTEGEARRQLRAQRHASAVPAYDALLATANGGLWVKDFTMPGADAAPQLWTIFDAEGRITGTIDMAARFTPSYVDGEIVLGVYRDSLDVLYVHAYTFGLTPPMAVSVGIRDARQRSR